MLTNWLESYLVSPLFTTSFIASIIESTRHLTILSALSSTSCELYSLPNPSTAIIGFGVLNSFLLFLFLF